MNNRVLIIDDDSGIRDDYYRILGRDYPVHSGSLLEIGEGLGINTPHSKKIEREKYDLVICESGIRGVKEVERALNDEKPFAVVFCDMRMPDGIDGLETGRRIRALDKRVEIVFVTAYTDKRWSDIVEVLGGPEKILYLKKPFHADEIRQLALKLTRSWQMEQNLKEALEKAKEADRAKSDFLSMVSHELKTPLTGIIGFVQILRLFLERKKFEEYPRFLWKIERSAFRLGDMVSELLAFSRLEASSLSLNFEIFNIKRYFESVYREEIELLLGEGRVRPFFDIPDLIVEADKGKLRHIIVNLTSNAIKFTSSGSIKVKCEEKKSDLLHFTISDTGRGIPEKSINKIYDVFFQVNKNADEQQGTGLGLAIVKKFVELHGGSIEVTSSEGSGTTFTFTIPARIKRRFGHEQNVFSN